MVNLRLKTDNGEIAEYHSGQKILDDLYLNMDKTEIDENLQNFNIVFEVIPNQVAINTTQRDHVAIVSIIVSEDRKYQYLVGPDLNLEQFEKLDQSQMPEMIKGQVREAFQLIQSK
ncbi:hypothetical protein [uncultured Christiangramia sp.]|uniref:hypothetical protein n=1 Tax=uncultured Christiangramia sp. TaxID=503836 RepID=UPI002603A27F|nr:hypothetical protein [uncultured Christiangramia sp.]